MRWLALSLMAICAFTVGCGGPTETVPDLPPSSSGATDADEGHDDHDHGDEGDEHSEEAESEDSASTSQPEIIRFVADKSVSVPGMQCPYSCWPKVKETLAAQPGVEDVQLAEQPEGTPEGEIKERVVELKLNGEFDAEAAVAALAEVNFDANVIN